MEVEFKKDDELIIRPDSGRHTELKNHSLRYTGIFKGNTSMTKILYIVEYNKQWFNIEGRYLIPKPTLESMLNCLDNMERKLL